jgi:hypothetical protein
VLLAVRYVFCMQDLLVVSIAMTDAATIDPTTEPVEAVPAPDAPTPDIEPIEALAAGSSASHAAPLEAGAATPEPPEPPAFDPRGELPASLGLPRRAILDALLDADGPLTVQQLWDAMPQGTTKNVAESSIHREMTAARIRRCGVGQYELAPFKPPAPPEPPAAAIATLAMAAGFGWKTDPDALAGMSEGEWFAALEAWYADPSTWDAAKFGPPPDHPDNRVPFDLERRFQERVRKRRERQAEAEERAALQRAADAELRDQLIGFASGFVLRGPRLNDVGPIRRVLADGIPMGIVELGIRNACDKRLNPKAQRAAAWADEHVLRSIAEMFFRRVMRPAMVSAWATAKSAPGEATGASDAPPAVEEPPAPEPAPEVFLAQSAPVPDGDAAHGIGEDARASILARFSRKAASAEQPAPPPRPWFAPAPASPPQEVEMSDEGWRFVLEGFAAGSVAWSRRHGPPPETPGCRVPAHILRDFGYHVVE